MAAPDDLQGRLYAKVSEVKGGMKLKCDGDFTCGIAKRIVEVKVRDDGTLYVDCDKGGHCLDSQIETEESDYPYYLGMYLINKDLK